MMEAHNPTGKNTLADVIAAHAQANPSGKAFIAGDEALTWPQYRDYSDALAAAFIAIGLAPGERVGILMPDGAGVHVAFVACEKAGVIGVGISGRAGRAEIEHLLRVTGAVAFLSTAQMHDHDTMQLVAELKAQGFPMRHHVIMPEQIHDDIVIDGKVIGKNVSAESAAQIEQRRAGPEDVFLLNTTSGTSGMPKCVQQHQSRWFKFAECAELASQLNPSDVFFCAVPASVGFGMWTGHFAPTLLGSPTVMLPKFSTTDLFKAIQTHKVTVLAAVSTQFIMMLNDPDLEKYDLSSLRVMFTGGEAVPYERAAQFEERTGASVLQFYGSNETGALCYTTSRDTRLKRLTTAGRIIDWMNVKLLDERTGEPTTASRGQPICKGPLLSYGYFNNDEGNKELFTADGWMKMSDIVTIDDDGYLTVVGRVGDFIIRGGKNISAAAVEEAVLKHPSIRMAAAVAMPDKIFGERVCVYVTLTPGASIDAPSLTRFLIENGVSKDWCPERVIVLDELPTVSGGKIAKSVLRQDIKDRVAAET
jgi:acyl-CoA synthetase